MTLNKSLEKTSMKTLFFIGLSIIAIIVTYVATTALVGGFVEDRCIHCALPPDIRGAYVLIKHMENGSANVTLYILFENNLKETPLYIYKVRIEDLNWTIKINQHIEPGGQYKVLEHRIFHRVNTGNDHFSLAIECRIGGGIYKMYTYTVYTGIPVYNETMSPHIVS